MSISDDVRAEDAFVEDLVMYLRNRQYKTVELNFYENNM